MMNTIKPVAVKDYIFESFNMYIYIYIYIYIENLLANYSCQFTSPQPTLPLRPLPLLR